MTKTILVPIDFSVASLNTLKIALEPYTEEPIEVILMYSEYLDDSITELLFHTSHKTVSNLITPDFKDALEIIINRFDGKIKCLHIEIFHGHNQNALRTFLEANRVDKIYIPRNYQLKTPKKAFSPIPLIRESNYHIIEVNIETDFELTIQEQILSLFN